MLDVSIFSAILSIFIGLCISSLIPSIIYGIKEHNHSVRSMTNPKLVPSRLLKIWKRNISHFPLIHYVMSLGRSILFSIESDLFFGIYNFLGIPTRTVDVADELIKLARLLMQDNYSREKFNLNILKPINCDELEILARMFGLKNPAFYDFRNSSAFLSMNNYCCHILVHRTEIEIDIYKCHDDHLVKFVKLYHD